MTNHKNSIPEARQIEIISSMMKLGDRLISSGDHEGVEELSHLSSQLNMHLTNDYVSFFDLGEYFFDTSSDIKNNTKQYEWTEDNRQRILDGLETYRRSSSSSK